MEIEFYRHVYKENASSNELDSGSMSTISWDKLLPLLNDGFKVAPNEKIVGIMITNDGIKAKFEIVSQC